MTKHHIPVKELGGNLLSEGFGSKTAYVWQLMRGSRWYGKQVLHKLQVWCRLLEKWVGLQGRCCEDWEWIAGEPKKGRDSSC